MRAEFKLPSKGRAELWGSEKENKDCLRGADNTIRNSMSSEIWELRNESQVCSVCGTEGDADHPQEGSKGPVYPSPLQSIKAHHVTVITVIEWSKQDEIFMMQQKWRSNTCRLQERRQGKDRREDYIKNRMETGKAKEAEKNEGRTEKCPTLI